MTPQPGSLARNFLSLAASRAVQVATGFGVLLAVARSLPLDDYGRYATVTALAGAVAAITYGGIQQVMIRDLAAGRADTPVIVGRAIVLRLFLTVAAGLVLGGIGLFPGGPIPLGPALALAFGIEACRAMGLLGCAVFQAYERMAYEPPLAVLSGAASLALVGLALFSGQGLPGVLAALLLAAGLHAALVWRVVVRSLVRPAFDRDRAALLRMLAATSVVGLGVFFQQNLFRANTLALAWLSNLSAVADFQAPHEFVLKLEILPQALMLAVYPVLARLAPADRPAAGRLYRLVFAQTLYAMALPAILLAVYAEPACLLLFGEKFAGAAPVLRLLALAVAPLALDMLVNTLLVALGRQRYALFYAAAALALNILGNLYAAPRHGAAGAAVVAVASYLWLLAFSSRFAARHGFRPRAAGPLLRVGCAGAVCLGACLLLRHAPLLGATAGTAVYAGVLAGLGAFGKNDLLLLRSVMGPRPPAGAKPGGLA
uniref:Membrane protein involved in the export of O-antigen and teichoic acid n=1 Tax=Desulfovibrio sp. U5L TaxID=596152 RepID=I2PYH8_9BACT